jgi:hypothetical protein
MHINNILAPEKYGFQKGMSTKNAAIKLTDSVFKSMNQYVHVGGIFADLAKAFHCINHKIWKLNYTFMAFKDQLQIGSDPI